MTPFVPCRIAELPEHARALAAARSIARNPHNALHGYGPQVPQHLTNLVGKLWPPGTTLRAGFVGRHDDAFLDHIVAHMNAWHDRGVGVRFVRSTDRPQVRVSLDPAGGHWSFIGTDIDSIPASRPTMNLALTPDSPESELVRVVRHETGHTLGFPHEHSRPELVALLDPAKTIAYYRRWQGWDERTIREQILDPLTRGSYTGTAEADPTSIMCYPFPDECLRAGAESIPGGVDLNDRDAAYALSVYPCGAVVAPAKPAASDPPQLRGSVGPQGDPIVLYVMDGGPERGYLFQGKSWISTRDQKTVVFKGPARRLD